MWINVGKVLNSRGMSLRELGRRLGVKPKVLTRIFAEGYDPNFSTVLGWAEAIGCGIEELMDSSLSSRVKTMPRMMPATFKASTKCAVCGNPVGNKSSLVIETQDYVAHKGCHTGLSRGTQAMPRRKKSRLNKCGSCGLEGHNIRRCPTLAAENRRLRQRLAALETSVEPGG